MKEFEFSKDQLYSSIFFAHNGPGPWLCFFCGKEVEAPWLNRKLGGHRFVVHHQDHNHHNDAVENLVPAHAGCHMSSHMKSRIAKDPAAHSAISKIGSSVGLCSRWKIGRGKPCVCGTHQMEVA